MNGIEGKDATRYRRIRIGAVGLGLAMMAGIASAQVSTQLGAVNLSIASFVQNDWAFSTSKSANPFNQHNLSTDGNVWNQMGFRGESTINFTLDRDTAARWGLDSARLLIQPRLFADLAPEVDDDLPEVNLFGGRSNHGLRYPGNGWLLRSVGTHEYVIDAKELYLDLRKGPLKLRLGKQQIAWGTALFLRSLDAVNSLDLTRHGIFDIIGNEYADERIAIWTALGTYQLPKVIDGVENTSVTAFVSPDFVPFILPAAGSAYNVLPSQVLLEDADEIARARHKLVYGGVLAATILGIDLTANFVATPQTLGVFSFAPATGPNAIPGSPFIVNPERGFNSLPDFLFAAERARLSVPDVVGTLISPPFAVPLELLADPAALDAFLRGTPVTAVATRMFPREYIFGGSASYYVQPIYTFPGAFLLNGNLFKVEGTYTPNKKFTSPGLSPTPKKAGELNFAVEMEKQIKWHPRQPSSYFVAEYWFKSRSDFFNRYLPAEGESFFHLVGVAVQQGVWGNRIRIDNSIVMDITSGIGLWYQPGVIYKPREYLELNLYYNTFEGDNEDIFGPIDSFDELFFKMTYKF